jgi:hypothetical protein
MKENSRVRRVSFEIFAAILADYTQQIGINIQAKEDGWPFWTC